MYRAIAPHDPDGILQFEWLNSRGAIARFDRHAIEIRVLDAQEHPGADLAIAQLVDFHRRTTLSRREQLDAADAIDTDVLAAILRECVKHGEAARIDNADYLRVFGIRRCADRRRSVARAREMERRNSHRIAQRST